MDYDVLNRIARCAMKGIFSQDTTDYWETLDPDAVLIVNSNPQAGDIRAVVAQMAQVWDDNIELKRRQLEATLQSNKTMINADRAVEEEKIREMVNRPKIELSDLGGLGQELARGAEHVGRATLSVFEWMHKYASKTGGIAEPQAKQEVRRRKESKSSSSSSASGSSLSGLGAFTNNASIRQQRLREEAVKAQQEAAAAGRTLEGKLGFSSISLTYGLPHMLVRDELYVHEDGKVVLVVRTALMPEEGYYPELIQARNLAVVDPTGGGAIPVDQIAGGSMNSSSGGSTTPRSGRRSLSPRINNNHNTTVAAPSSTSAMAASGRRQVLISSSPSAVHGNNNTNNQTSLTGTVSPRGVTKHSSTGCAANSGSKVLDFSFKQIAQPYDLLRTEPTNFVRHLRAPVAKEAPKTAAEEMKAKKNKDASINNNNNNNSSSNHFSGSSMMNNTKEGEEGEGRFGGLGGVDSNKKSTVNAEFEQLVNNLRTKVVCDSVRLCNNEIEDAYELLPVLRNLVVNHYLRVRWLDLSNNKLREIPPEIAQMPLQALHLHGNNIESWRSIEEELPKLTRLQHLTIFGNPVAQNASTFRPRALGLLLHAPFKLLPFKSLDFVPLTLVDVQSAAAFLRTHPRALDITHPDRVSGSIRGKRSQSNNNNNNNNSQSQNNGSVRF